MVAVVAVLERGRGPARRALRRRTSSVGRGGPARRSSLAVDGVAGRPVRAVGLARGPLLLCSSSTGTPATGLLPRSPADAAPRRPRGACLPADPDAARLPALREPAGAPGAGGRRARPVDGRGLPGPPSPAPTGSGAAAHLLSGDAERQRLRLTAQPRPGPALAVLGRGAISTKGEAAVDAAAASCVPRPQCEIGEAGLRLTTREGRVRETPGAGSDESWRVSCPTTMLWAAGSCSSASAYPDGRGVASPVHDDPGELCSPRPQVFILRMEEPAAARASRARASADGGARRRHARLRRGDEALARLVSTTSPRSTTRSRLAARPGLRRRAPRELAAVHPLVGRLSAFSSRRPPRRPRRRSTP